VSDVPPPAEPSVKKPRFKAPDTMTREQWDEMRHNLPERIDEVMASFREDKLSVKPRAPAQQQEDDGQSTLFLLSDIPDPVRKKHWPWIALGLTLVSSVVAIYLYNEHAANLGAANKVEPSSSITSGKITDPNIPTPAPTPDSALTSAPVVPPATAIAPDATKQATTPVTVPATTPTSEIPNIPTPTPRSAAVQPAAEKTPPPEVKSPVAPAKSKPLKNKAGAKQSKPAHAADEEVRTIEDLTPLLRGKDAKQP